VSKKIGIYGGSFDPIHHGHINLAVEMSEAHQLDEVMFCPSFVNPNKIKGSSASGDHRLAMLNLAIAGEPKLRILDWELRRGGPSYTIDTLHELMASQAGKPEPDHFFLIIGDDAAQHFYRWRQPEEIVKICTLLVGRRSFSSACDDLKGSSAPLIEAVHKGLTLTRILEISSSEIRKRLAKRQYCGHLVHSKVLDYIHLHDLYLMVDS
jgi:nicotinate-nucleotide adenylyltransferase